MNYSKVIVATDGSKASEPALREATRLAQNQHAKLRIIFVVDESFIYHGGPGYDHLLYLAACREEGQSILNKAAKVIEKKRGIDLETALIELEPFHGRIADAIVEEAKRWHADILVIGTHGRKGFSHIFMGSVAENVIRIATIPVLLVKQKEG